MTLWSKMTLVPDCYGADIDEPGGIGGITDFVECQQACEDNSDCIFMSFGVSNVGNTRCILKNGLTSTNACTGCKADGSCGNIGGCDTTIEVCSMNILRNCKFEKTLAHINFREEVVVALR